MLHSFSFSFTLCDRTSTPDRFNIQSWKSMYPVVVMFPVHPAKVLQVRWLNCTERCRMRCHYTTWKVDSAASKYCPMRVVPFRFSLLWHTLKYSVWVLSTFELLIITLNLCFVTSGSYKTPIFTSLNWTYSRDSVFFPSQHYLVAHIPKST